MHSHLIVKGCDLGGKFTGSFFPEPVRPLDQRLASGIEQPGDLVLSKAGRELYR